MENSTIFKATCREYLLLVTEMEVTDKDKLNELKSVLYEMSDKEVLEEIINERDVSPFEKPKGLYNKAKQKVGMYGAEKKKGFFNQAAAYQKYHDRFDVVATGVVIASALTMGYKIYQKFFSKMATKCKGLSGDQKKECNNKFKTKAMDAQIKVLERNKKYCKKAKDPVKCKSVIDKKINKIKNQIKKLKG